MKFSEKLQTLRKENKMSQEVLADMVDVSRQSVSKWESGQAYPEMDKLLTLCKIFKCSLDDLTNDEVSEINIENKAKVTPSNLVDQFLNIIKQVYTKVTNMTAKEITKMIVEIFVILFVIFMISIPYHILTSEILGVINNQGIEFLNFIASILDLIFEIIFIIIGTIIFAYIFKLRYLEELEINEIITKEEIKRKETKNIEKTNENKEQQEIKIVKQNNHNIIDFLAAIVIGFIKFITGMISLSFVFTILALVIVLALFVIALFKEIVFVGAIISLLGTTIIFILLTEIGFNFVFNNKTNFKKIFIVGILSIVLIGSGVSITTYEVSQYSYINELSPLIEKELVTKEVTYKDTLFIQDYWNGNIIYKEDNELKGNKIIIEYENTECSEIELIEASDYIYFRDNTNINAREIFDDIIKHLKEKKIYNYECLSETDIVIKANNSIINKLKNNKENYYSNQEYQELREMIENYEMVIEEQQETIEDLEDRINELTE